jgi:hypothetical protein
MNRRRETSREWETADVFSTFQKSQNNTTLYEIFSIFFEKLDNRTLIVVFGNNLIGMLWMNYRDLDFVQKITPEHA